MKTLIEVGNSNLSVHVGQPDRHDVVVRHLDELRPRHGVLLLTRVGEGDEAALVEAISLANVLDGWDPLHDLQSNGGGEKASASDEDLEAAHVVARHFRRLRQHSSRVLKIYHYFKTRYVKLMSTAPTFYKQLFHSKVFLQLFPTYSLDFLTTENWCKKCWWNWPLVASFVQLE